MRSTDKQLVASSSRKTRSSRLRRHASSHDESEDSKFASVHRLWRRTPKRRGCDVILMKNTNAGNGTKLASRRARREVAAGAKSKRSKKMNRVTMMLAAGLVFLA